MILFYSTKYRFILHFVFPPRIAKYVNLKLLVARCLGNKASEILIQKVFHGLRTIFLKVYSARCVLSK